MAHKDSTIAAEVKAVAKAIGSNLKAKHHAVPHSVLLHSVSAALGEMNWHQLKAKLSGETESAADMLAAVPVIEIRGPSIAADFYTDDRAVAFNFDAAAWASHADSEALKALCDCGFGGDYPSDAIADWMAAQGDEAFINGFRYLDARNSASRQTTGFEVHVNKKDFGEWLLANEPAVLAQYLCDYFEISLVEAEEEEIRGRWDWLDDEGNASECSLETMGAAARDAMERLNLWGRFKAEFYLR